MNKKIVSFVLSACLALPATMLLTGCDGHDDNTVMNVSLNPSVEFILDSNDKVVSVNAKNEEGNLILSAQANGEQFVGKDASSAVKLFASYSKEMGFLFEGNVKNGENEIKIQFSGNKGDADKLFNSIKEDLSSYLEELDVSGTLTKLDTLTKEKIQELLLECEPYLNMGQIKKWSNDEMIEKIKDSRDETKEFLSQELKNAYYEAKEFAVKQAKFEKVREQLNLVQQATLDAVTKIYTSACTTLDKTREDMFVKDESVYQVALNAFREKKAEFLNYKNYVQEKDFGDNEEARQQAMQTLAKIETALNNAETALENAKTTALNGIENAKASVTNAYNTVVDNISKMGKDVNDLLDKAGNDINDSIDNFETSFKGNYSKYQEKAKQEWERMKNSLIAGYQE